MLVAHDGKVMAKGDEIEILSDTLAIMVSITDLVERGEIQTEIIGEVFHEYPEEVTNFVKIFVKASR